LDNNIFVKVLKRIGFWFPILLLIFIKGNYIDLYNFYGNIILASIIISFSNLFNYKKINFIFEGIGVIFFNIIMFIQIIHYYLFSENIKPSTFFIIFNSNAVETTEFLSMYIDYNVILIVATSTLVSMVSIYISSYNIKSKTKLKFSIGALLIIFVLLTIRDIRRNTFPHILYRAISEYQYDKKKYNEITQDRLGGEFSEVKHKSNNENEVYVLIIGESTTRGHLGLYNYYRNTNPRLNMIKKNLIIFNDIISPHTHTLTSLEKVLTLASSSSPDRKYSGTLIQLFNKAGFKTYWLSNQKPIGIYETATTIISKNCDEQIFVNTTDRSLDEKVLHPLKEILEQKIDKKFIVIHLMGTHGAYVDRYPVSFRKFRSKPLTEFNHEKAYETINTYDNAVLYNDFIISEIIEEIERTNSKSYVLYFSDHGEDVYETKDMAFHTESKGTKPMYDIPFILWRSEKFKLDENNFTYDAHRKYSSENLLYTLSDLSNITFKEFDSTKSLVNKNFIPEKRFILNHVDYDAFFESNK
jgi:heptose-I-phosphate ethanolaminephosphotransferase